MKTVFSIHSRGYESAGIEPTIEEQILRDAEIF